MAYRDGAPVADCLMEAASWHKTVKVACRCGHAVFYDPHALWWLCERKGWSGSFQGLRERFYCSRCRDSRLSRVRPNISAMGVEEPTVLLPMPPEREWRRARARFR